MDLLSFSFSFWGGTRSLLAGLRVAQPCRYCFYSNVQKWVFRPTGTTCCPINVKFGMGSGPMVVHIFGNILTTYGPLPHAKFHVYRGRNVGIQSPKLSKFQILVRNLYLRGDSFAMLLRNSQHLYASTDSF